MSGLCQDDDDDDDDDLMVIIEFCEITNNLFLPTDKFPALAALQCTHALYIFPFLRPSMTRQGGPPKKIHGALTPIGQVISPQLAINNAIYKA